MIHQYGHLWNTTKYLCYYSDFLSQQQSITIFILLVESLFFPCLNFWLLRHQVLNIQIKLLGLLLIRKDVRKFDQMGFQWKILLVWCYYKWFNNSDIVKCIVGLCNYSTNPRRGLNLLPSYQDGCNSHVKCHNQITNHQY